LCDHVGVRKVIRVLKALVPQPEDVEVDLVPLHQILVSERMESFGLFPFQLVCSVVTGDEVVQVLVLQRIRLEREVHVGAKVVDPQRLCPGSLAGRLLVEEEDVCLHALRIEDTGGKPKERVDIALGKHPPANGFTRPAFE